MIYDYYCVDCGNKIEGGKINFDLAEMIGLRTGDSKGVFGKHTQVSAGQLKGLAGACKQELVHGTKTRIEISLRAFLQIMGWNAGGAPLLVEQSDGSYGLAISNFPGGQDFKISIDKTWTCFLAQDGRTTLEFAVPYTCARANNDNNFNVGVSGTNYNVWISLVVAANAQSAEITVTETTTGITLLSTAVEKADEVFNVAGQRLSQPAKGLNIINGKKVLVK